MRPAVSIAAAGLLGALLLPPACSVFRRDPGMTPGHREFLSRVRYIITKEEKKRFRNLPEMDRDAFISDFWTRRDPDPETEENEFRIRYFQRIEEANRLFRTGSTPGWLQDRGRIYILLGAPDERRPYPEGWRQGGPPAEIWYYGFYPITFYRYTYGEAYRLSPGSAQYLSMLLKAAQGDKALYRPKDRAFDFGIDLKKTGEGGIRIRVNVPYRSLWLAETDGRLKTDLILSINVTGKAGEPVWSRKRTAVVDLAPEELERIGERDFVIEIEHRFQPGEYRMTLRLENRTDQRRVEKTIAFKI